MATSTWCDLGRRRRLSGGTGCRTVGGPRCRAAECAADSDHVCDAPLPEWFEVAAPAGFRQWQERRARDFIESAIKVAEESTGERGPVRIDSKVFYSATVPTLVGLS